MRILRSANALIAHNPKLFDKRLWSELGHGDTMRVAPAADDEAEAELVLRACAAHKFEHRATYADYAILYRGNHQARVFETALRAQSVPYEISGGQSLFERPEIKDIVAYLRLHRQRRRRSGVRARGDHAASAASGRRRWRGCPRRRAARQ